MFLPRRCLQQRPLPPRLRARQSQSKPSSSFCLTLSLGDDSKTKCREPMTPKRDVKGARTIIAGGGSSNSFQRQNTRFPATFIADRAAEVEQSGEELRDKGLKC